MIDLDLFKIILEPKPKPNTRLIIREDYISKEILSFFSQYQVGKVMNLFESVTDIRESWRIRVWVVCPECKKGKDRFLNKTNLQGLLSQQKNGRGYYDGRCEDCKIKADIENDKTNKIFEQHKAERRYKNWEAYKDNLNPDYSWLPETSHRDRFNAITRDWGIDDLIESAIKEMDYSDFLKTCYWKAIANRKRYEAKYSCELCPSKIDICVHHKTYEHHGLEHRYYKIDLICLCRKCHEKHHDKIPIAERVE